MIRKRILQYLELKGISKYKFYQITGLSNGFLDKDGAIGSDKCEKICYEYTDISIVWLITGKGSMLASNSTEVIQEQTNYKELAESRLETINLLKEKVANLNKEILELTENQVYGSSVKKGAVEFLNEPQLGGISGKKG